MRLTESEKQTLAAIFSGTDHEVAQEVRGGSLHAGTALAVLTEFSRQVEKFDAHFAEKLAPRLTMEVAR